MNTGEVLKVILAGVLAVIQWLFVFGGSGFKPARRFILPGIAMIGAFLLNGWVGWQTLFLILAYGIMVGMLVQGYSWIMHEANNGNPLGYLLLSVLGVMYCASSWGIAIAYNSLTTGDLWSLLYAAFVSPMAFWIHKKCSSDRDKWLIWEFFGAGVCMALGYMMVV